MGKNCKMTDVELFIMQKKNSSLKKPRGVSRSTWLMSVESEPEFSLLISVHSPFCHIKSLPLTNVSDIKIQFCV